MNAMVGDGTSGPITQEAVTHAATELVSRAGSRLGAKITIVEAAVATIGNVHVGRTIADVDVGPNIHLRMLQYLLPGGRRSAMLTYTADRATFASYLPAFEAAAAKTTGLEEPRPWRFDWVELAVSGAVGGAIGTPFAWHLRRQR
jgi:hypothetical protein